LFGFLKIQSLDQHGQLRVIDGHLPVLQLLAIRDAEAAGFQQLAAHHEPARLPAQQLDAVAAAVEEDVHSATRRRLLHVVGHKGLQAVEALAHVARRNVQPEPHVARQAQRLSPRVGERAPIRSTAASPRRPRGSGFRGCKRILRPALRRPNPRSPKSHRPPSRVTCAASTGTWRTERRACCTMKAGAHRSVPTVQRTRTSPFDAHRASIEAPTEGLKSHDVKF
jgi:hypothetical protein